MSNRNMLLCAMSATLLSGAPGAVASYGLKFEVRLPGQTTWQESVFLINISGGTVEFRVGVYVDPLAPITVPDGTGNAVAMARFIGSTRLSGILAEDVIKDLKLLAPDAGPELMQVSGNRVGTSSILSFAQQIFPGPLPTAPKFYNPLYQGVIVVKDCMSPRLIEVRAASFGASGQPGLTFYTDASPVNKQIGIPPFSRSDEVANIYVQATGQAPTIVGPVSQHACVGGAAELSIEASGPNSESYDFHWRKNGTYIPGATSKTLFFPFVRASDRGTYTCVVFGYDCASSQSAQLFVCIADFNCDNVVDDADFSTFAVGYNLLDCADPSMPTGCLSDLNSDGFVDDADFQLFVPAYNTLACP